MKKVSFLFFIVCCLACTSNTIFEEPKDLIPKDSMILITEDLIIASSSKYIKNKNGDKNINYLPLLKEKYNVDSTRFANSNLYYVSKIDMYLEMLNEVRSNIDAKKKHFVRIKQKKDSLQLDSLKQVQKLQLDSLILKKDTLKIDSLKYIFEDEIIEFEEKLNSQDN